MFIVFPAVLFRESYTQRLSFFHCQRQLPANYSFSGNTEMIVIPSQIDEKPNFRNSLFLYLFVILFS